MTPETIYVKICFVLDCTASMSPWIRQAKTRMVELVDNVRRENPQAEILVSFVGYRDYGDAEQFIVIPFLKAQDTMEQIQRVQADGGDDQAEDIAHGLQRALHMDWTNSHVKILFHIADAPAHGLAFHHPRLSDRFPRGDPHGLDPRDIVERMSFLGIDFTFVKVDASTDTMIEQFHTCYANGGTFSVIDLYSQGHVRRVVELGDPILCDAMTVAVNRSITTYTASQVP